MKYYRDVHRQFHQNLGTKQLQIAGYLWWGDLKHQISNVRIGIWTPKGTAPEAGAVFSHPSRPSMTGSLGIELAPFQASSSYAPTCFPRLSQCHKAVNCQKLCAKMKSPWDIRFQSKKTKPLRCRVYGIPVRIPVDFEFYLKYLDCGHMNTPYYTWINIRIPSMHVLCTYFCLILMVNSQGKYTVPPMDASWDMMQISHPKNPKTPLKSTASLRTPSGPKHPFRFIQVDSPWPIGGPNRRFLGQFHHKIGPQQSLQVEVHKEASVQKVIPPNLEFGKRNNNTKMTTPNHDYRWGVFSFFEATQVQSEILERHDKNVADLFFDNKTHIKTHLNLAILRCLWPSGGWWPPYVTQRLVFQGSECFLPRNSRGVWI